MDNKNEEILNITFGEATKNYINALKILQFSLCNEEYTNEDISLLSRINLKFENVLKAFRFKKQEDKETGGFISIATLEKNFSFNRNNNKQ